MRTLTPSPSSPVTPAEPPQFSIIVPTYEAASTVAEAVASALAQTYPAKEVIVCDDGSRDDPASALAPVMDRIVFFRQDNAGPSEARNAAIARATGEFIVNLDADDVLAPGNLAARAELLRRRPDLDIVCTNGAVTVGGETVKSFYQPDWEFEVDDQRAAILQRCFIIFWAARRSRILEVGGFDNRVSQAEDLDLWIRMIFSGSRAGLVDEPLATYRLHRDSLSTHPLGVLGARMAALEKALASGDLNQREAAIARGVIEGDRLDYRLAAATEALLERDPAARSQLRSLVTTRGLSRQARARAAIAWLAPGPARRLLTRRGQHTSGDVFLPPTG
ncbi:MAG TPA: glycosyltransferase [Solirubrobacterales bacterium]|nr:glycosyltransferase [Solirubrobacterales bacterium]